MALVVHLTNLNSFLKTLFYLETLELYYWKHLIRLSLLIMVWKVTHGLISLILLLMKIQLISKTLFKIHKLSKNKSNKNLNTLIKQIKYSLGVFRRELLFHYIMYFKVKTFMQVWLLVLVFCSHKHRLIISRPLFLQAMVY